MARLRPVLQSALRAFIVVALIALAADLSDLHYTGATDLHHADSLRALSAVVAQLVLGSSAGAARISARALNQKRERASFSGQAGSSRRRRARQPSRDQVLEIPQAIDSSPRDQDRGESNATVQDADNDLQLGPASVANDAPEFLSGMLRAVGTLQDYENGAKNRPVPMVCIGPKWWWTSGVPVCTPIAPSSNTAQPHDSP
jgi:hypothetical protein